MRWKKGVESIEVWMWLVAGLIVGLLIFVSVYGILSNWTKRNEAKLAEEDFFIFVDSISEACNMGSENLDKMSIVLPEAVLGVYVSGNERGGFVFGDEVFFEIEDQRTLIEDMSGMGCDIPVVMKDLNLSSEEDSLFSRVNRILGKSDSRRFDFYLFKKDENLCIKWKEVHIENEESELELIGKGGLCEVDCECIFGSRCDSSGHCCPYGYQFVEDECRNVV